MDDDEMTLPATHDCTFVQTFNVLIRKSSLLVDVVALLYFDAALDKTD